MKKSIFILTTAIVLIFIWACSESDNNFDHANPFDPGWGNVTALNNLELQIEKIDRIKVIWDSDYFNKDGYTFQVDRKIGESGVWQEKYKVFTKEINFFTDSIAAINETNFYRVRVTYDLNLSDPVEASVSNPFPAPSNLNLNRSDIKTIHLSWSDNSNGEDGFKIDRYANGVWNEEYTRLGANLTSWTDSTVALNDSVQYRVYAYRKTSESASTLTERIENSIPAPTGLTIKQNDVSTFELQWTDNSNGEEGFIIQRSIDGVPFSPIDSLSANTTQYLDPTVGKGKGLNDVSYRVMSYYGNFTSNYAENIAAIEFPAPSAVGYEKLTVSSLRIFWTDNSISEDGFRIDKKTGAGNWVLNYATVGTDVKSWTDISAEINETLQYRIYAFKGINSTTTAESPIITNTFPSPSSLTYSKLTISTIKLNWTDNSSGEDGFKIDRSVNGTWTNSFVTLPANTVTYADGNVPVNQNIQYRIYAYKGADQSSTINTSSIANTFPAPSNPILSQLAVNIVRLDWTDNSFGEDGFRIDRKDNSGVWTNNYASLSADAVTWNDSTAVISDSLQYRIYAFKGTDNSAYATAYASDLTFPPPTEVQFVKMNLNTIALYWTDNCIGETGYKIDRQIDGGAWETAVGTVGADIQTWSDSNVPLNAGVQYRIYAYTATDQSSYGYSELITNNIPMPVLDTVSQLSVGSFKLDWTDNSNGEDGFKIERKIDDGTYTQIATPAANTVTYTDSSINKKGYTTVFYRIKAYKGTDESDYSENSQTVSFPAPTGINYSKVSVNSINVTWADNSDGEDGFKIDKKVGALAWVTGYGSAAANATSWLDTNAEPNTSIQYKVYAYKGLNTSASNLSAVIDNTFPAPTNISTEKLTLSSIKLNWNDNSTGETGFIIERKVGVQNWAAYDSTATNAVTWTDANATINETLQYRIRAYKDNYASTNLESAQIDNTIPAPSNLNANVNGMSITLNWQDNSTGEDGFKIDRMVGDGVWEDDYASVGSNIITWNETVADTGKYYYRVKASVAESSSTYSEISEAWINQIVTYIKTYGEASQEERGYSIINVDDGYIVTGMCNPSGYHDDILLLKLNYNGNKIFEKQINPINGNCNDIGYSVVKTEDDGFFVTGVTDGNGANDVLLVKTDNNGDMQWYKTYGSAYADEGRQIINCSDGNYVIVGTLDGYPSEGFKVLLLKIDPLGNSIWQKTFTNGSSGNQYGYSVAETADGDFVIAGTTTAQTLGGKDAFIIKTNSSGDLIWAENYGTTMEDEAFSITISPDNKYVFAGYNGIGSQDIWLVKLDTNNSVIWNKTYGSTTLDDGAFSICKDPDNSGYIVGGYCQLQTGASQNFFIGKANSDGDFIWTKNYDYGLGRSEYGYTAIPTTDSGYIIVGYGSESSSNPLNNLMFVKTNSSGSVIKSK